MDANLDIINTTKDVGRELNAVLQNLGILAFISLSLSSWEFPIDLTSKLFDAVSLEGRSVTRDSCLSQLVFKEFGEEKQLVRYCNAGYKIRFFLVSGHLLDKIQFPGKF